VVVGSWPKRQAQREMMGDELSEYLVTLSDSTSAAAEAYRTLRTGILHALVETSLKVIVVTSPGSAEGKSTVCANLGVVLAQAGRGTLIVDCDLRRPVMHKIFGLSSSRGVVDALTREHSLQESYQEPLPDLALKVLTAGALPPNPAELLSDRRLSEFFASVREEFDHVLVDSPPIGLVSDPIILATQGDGVLLTLDARKTSKGDLQRAMYSLRTVGANVLGTVVNNAKGGRGGYG
jgi:capsular exopolysaccharide synthesis family protein